MSPLKRTLLFFVLPFVAVLAYPPGLLANADWRLLGFVAIVFIGLGLLLWSGRMLILTLSIFLQGMNVIIRIMMLFPNAMNKTTGVWNISSTIATIIGLALSLYLILRLDKSDVRTTMIK